MRHELSLMERLDSERVNLYLWWIRERLRIHHKRFCLKQPPPWTEDEVLQTRWFCNPFRELDRGTRLYLEHTKGYETSRDYDGLFLYTFLYRVHNSRWFFDIIPAPMRLEIFLRDFQTILNEYQRKKESGAKFRMAYLISPPVIRSKGDKFEAWLKWAKEHIDLFRIHHFPHLLADPYALADYISNMPNSMGDFISYQIVTDMSYSTLTTFSDDFVEMGAGVVAAINVLLDLPEETYKSRVVLDKMTHLLGRDSEYVNVVKELSFMVTETMGNEFWNMVTECGVGKRRFSYRNVEHSLNEFRKWFNHKFGIQQNRRSFKWKESRQK